MFIVGELVAVYVIVLGTVGLVGGHGVVDAGVVDGFAEDFCGGGGGVDVGVCGADWQGGRLCSLRGWGVVEHASSIKEDSRSGTLLILFIAT